MESVTSDDFITFLLNLLTVKPLSDEKNIVLVVDNIRIHHSKKDSLRNELNNFI